MAGREAPVGTGLANQIDGVHPKVLNDAVDLMRAPEKDPK